MREVKFCPGPWQWYWHRNTDKDPSEAECGVFVEKRPGHAYSVCRAPRYEKKEQWEANARLIAAAPDLVEAARIGAWYLEQHAKNIRSLDLEGDLGRGPIAEERDLGTIHAAIKKATEPDPA